MPKTPRRRMPHLLVPVTACGLIAAAPAGIVPVAGAHAASASAPPILAQAGQPTDPADAAPSLDAAGNLAPGQRDAAPDTDTCPHRLTPAEPQTTSERLAPGQSSPTPPPPAATTDCGITAAPGFRVPEKQTAAAWLVFDIDSGEVLAQKDPHGRYRPASIIKVLLALTAIDELDLDQQVPVSRKAADMEGSAAGIGTTGSYTVRDLLYGLLLSSGNDAAQALAEALGGEEATLEKVNALAARLGARDTHVADFTGLDKPGQMTSAHDLALMYRAAWQNPTFADMVATEYVNFPGHHDNDAEAGADSPADGPGAQEQEPAAHGAPGAAPGADRFTDDDPANGFQLWNDNNLFMNDPDGIGGKTGYTDDAHHTFVGALQRGPRRLAVVLLDTTIDKGRAWEQAQRFLHAAYEVPAGRGIGSLDASPGGAGAPQDGGSPEGTDLDAPHQARGPEQARDGVWSEHSGLWIGGGAVLAVLAAAAVGVWLTRRR